MTGKRLDCGDQGRTPIGKADADEAAPTVDRIVTDLYAVRYVTPVIHMRRNAIADPELGAKQITKGDKVVLWYVSGNRDSDEIDLPDEFIIDQTGAGSYRCERYSRRRGDWTDPRARQESAATKG